MPLHIYSNLSAIGEPDVILSLSDGVLIKYFAHNVHLLRYIVVVLCDWILILSNESRYYLASCFRFLTKCWIHAVSLPPCQIIRRLNMTGFSLYTVLHFGFHFNFMFLILELLLWFPCTAEHSYVYLIYVWNFLLVVYFLFKVRYVLCLLYLVAPFSLCSAHFYIPLLFVTFLFATFNNHSQGSYYMDNFFTICTL